MGELPLSTQARLLRVLENGEFIKVGGSKVMKTDVRVVAATNVNMPLAIQQGRFREDLFYRLNTIPITIPPLRDRKGDIHILFRKFAADFAERSKMPGITLTPDAVKVLEDYRWDGNIRQLKNVTEQISIMETERSIDAATLDKYLPKRVQNALPVLMPHGDSAEGISERDLLYRVLFDMKKDIAELRATVNSLTNGRPMEQPYEQAAPVTQIGDTVVTRVGHDSHNVQEDEVEQEFMEVLSNDDSREHNEIMSLDVIEKEMIIKALEKHKGKRKEAAKNLGISERTLYRKINEYGLDL